MESSQLLQPQEIYIEIEQKYLCYLISKNPDDCVDFNDKFFLNSNLKIIFQSIKELIINKTKFEIDILYDTVRQKTSEITKEDIILISKAYTDFDNIENTKRRIKENYLKQKSTKEIVGNILNRTTNSGDLDIESVKKFNTELSNTLMEIEHDEDNCLTFTDIIDKKYNQLLENRNLGIGKKTLGLSYLDKAITYPAEPGDIMTIALRKGSGKTSIALNITNALINRDVPVVYICLDMGEVTIMDRMICMLEGITNTELLQEDKDDFIKQRIESGLKKLKSIPNFILYPEGSISLDEFKSYILKVKKKFKANGTFKNDDDYFVVIFDTIDMVEDFSGVDAYGIKKGINKLSTILKDNNLFAINLNQINENQIRSNKPKKYEDCDKIKFTKEDIEGGASYASRSRVVLIGTRPLELKKSFFPEEEELLALESDELFLNLDKQNDGPTGRLRPLIFDPNTFRVYIKGD